MKFVQTCSIIQYHYCSMARLILLKYIIALFIILPVTTGRLVAQRHAEDARQMSGIISDEYSKPLSYSHIIIVNAGKGTISDRSGRYSVIVYPGDTLVFSSIGHKRVQKVVPENIAGVHYSHDVHLPRDTFEIREITVYPWNTYEEFKEAFIALDLPEDDYDRAIANIALIQTWLEIEGLPADPSSSFRVAMQQHYNRNMYAGQPPNNLLNPFSWAKFIQAIRDGKFQSR